MIKKNKPTEGPNFGEGSERVEWNVTDNGFDLYFVKEDGSSWLVATKIADHFELQEAVDWFAKKTDSDGDLLYAQGRESFVKRADSFTAADPAEVGDSK